MLKFCTYIGSSNKKVNYHLVLCAYVHVMYVYIKAVQNWRPSPSTINYISQMKFEQFKLTTRAVPADQNSPGLTKKNIFLRILIQITIY